MRDYYVYVMCNESGTLYTGVTNNLERRVDEHKRKLIAGFTSSYNITRLVYYEAFQQIWSAIARENQTKSWRRRKKLDLIVSMNPRWEDLAGDWYEDLGATGRTGVRPLAEFILSPPQADEGLGVTEGARDA